MTDEQRGSPARIAVFASGGGSNLGAILDHLHTLGEQAAGSVVLVASDRRGANALERARQRGIAAVHLDAPANGAAIEALLRDHRIDLIALAGYLRLVPPQVIDGFRGRIVNVHPTLLPSFGGPGMYGIRAHQAVIATGARISGASVHFVDEQYDRGALIAQWPVPVAPDDTPESLASRVLRIEHLLYPRVVDAVARGAVRLGVGGRVEHAGSALEDDAMFVLGDPDDVRPSIDLALGLRPRSSGHVLANRQSRQ